MHVHLPHRRPRPPAILVEHCPTCEQRAELLRRNRGDCTVVEHTSCMQRLGQMIVDKHDAGEFVTALLHDERRWHDEANRLQARLDAGEAA